MALNQSTNTTLWKNSLKNTEHQTIRPASQGEESPPWAWVPTSGFPGRCCWPCPRCPPSAWRPRPPAPSRCLWRSPQRRPSSRLQVRSDDEASHAASRPYVHLLTERWGVNHTETSKGNVCVWSGGHDHVSSRGEAVRRSSRMAEV